MIQKKIFDYNTIVADGDFDGVTAVLLILYARKNQGATTSVRVLFPHPTDNSKYDNSIVVERCERRGANSICIDHHLGNNIGYIETDDGRSISGKSYPSVARYVAELLGLDNLPEPLATLLRYADVIDSTNPMEVPSKLSSVGLDPRVYSGYRALIASPLWRRMVAVKGPENPVAVAEWLIKVFAEAGKLYEEMVLEYAERLVASAKTVETPKGRITAFRVELGRDVKEISVAGYKFTIDIQQSAAKPVMARLEKEPNTLAVASLNVDPTRGVSVTIASPAGVADKLAAMLKEKGYAKSGGGRARIAGAQGLTIESVDELLRILAELANNL